MDEEMILCPSCEGAGEYSIGDCEDGVTDTCAECEGLGQVPDPEGIDTFVPERDAWRIND